MSLFKPSSSSKSAQEKLYGINPSCRILLNKFTSKNLDKPCIALRLWMPLKFINSSTDDNTLVPTKSAIWITEYHAHDLVILLQKILEPKESLAEPPVQSNWKQPKNSVIFWANGEKVKLKDKLKKFFSKYLKRLF